MWIPRPRSFAWRTGAAAVLAGALVAVVGGVALGASTVTRSEAKAVAAKISLRHGDLPAFQPVPNPDTAAEERLTAEAVKCAGGVPVSKAFVNTQSTIFQQTTSSSSVATASGTEILPTPALVAKDYAALARPHALSCLQSELEQSLLAGAPTGSKVTSASTTRRPIHISGINGVFSIRVAMNLEVPTGSKSATALVYADEIGFTDGQAEVSMIVQTTGVLPSSALEQRLLGLLVERARTALG
jgi:hypothetical protein